jgi:hypothetical protein
LGAPELATGLNTGKTFNAETAKGQRRKEFDAFLPQFRISQGVSLDNPSVQS